jgi:DNA repair exonuclease SbcCD ATPase subunit
MKLESIELENWKQHTTKKIVFDKQATVIHGPNESGKSTVFEALHRGLFDRHNSSSKGIKKITPLNARGKISSTVCIVFTVSGERYRLEKTFNYKGKTKLYRFTNGNLDLIAQDNPADQIVLDMLEAEMQRKSVSDPSKWGAFYWLWSLQDKRELPSDGDISVLKLDQVEGNVLMTPKLESVRSQFTKIYTQYYSEKTGRPRKYSPLLVAEESLEDLSYSERGLAMRISEVEKFKNEMNSKLEELPKLIFESGLIKERQRAAQEESAEYEILKSDIEASESKIEAIQGVFDNAAAALVRLQDVAEKIKTHREQDNHLSEQFVRAEVDFELSEKGLIEIENIIDDNSDSLAKVDELLADARAQYTKKTNQEQQEKLSKKIQDIGDLGTRIEQMEMEILDIVINSSDLIQLEEDAVKLELNKLRLQESGMIVERENGSDGKLSVLTDKNEMNETSGSAIEEVVVFHQKFGKVRIRADLEKAQQIQQEVETLSNVIEDKLEKNNVSSIKELRAIFENNQKFNNEISKINANIRGIDDRPLNVIEKELAELLEKANGYELIERSDYVLQNNPINDELSSLISERERSRLEFDEILREHRGTRDEIRKKNESNKDNRAQINTDREIIRTQLRDAEEAQQELIQQFGSESIQTVKKEKEQEKLDLETENLERLELNQKDYEDGPLATIKQLDEEIEILENLINETRDTSNQLKGKIDEYSLEGIYSNLSVIQSQIDDQSERVKSEKVSAGAIKVLKEILEDQYNSNLGAITVPIKLDTEKYLAYITDKKHEEVELSDNLFPLRMGERGVSELSLDYEDGSSGLREVIGICVRLAIAKNICSIEPQSLVLDDPFVHVSEDRSKRIIELINQIIVETGLQVIILTHRPLEFSGFKGTRIDIEK